MARRRRRRRRRHGIPLLHFLDKCRPAPYRTVFLWIFHFAHLPTLSSRCYITIRSGSGSRSRRCRSMGRVDRRRRFFLTAADISSSYCASSWCLIRLRGSRRLACCSRAIGFPTSSFFGLRGSCCFISGRNNGRWSVIRRTGTWGERHSRRGLFRCLRAFSGRRSSWWVWWRGRLIATAVVRLVLWLMACQYSRSTSSGLRSGDLDGMRSRFGRGGRIGGA
jgi:hypothetical protein